MSPFILHLLDYFFILFHSLLILFNLFGWLIQRWRMANLITLSLTAFSWFILGIWYGIGYCPFTDWHWKVRQLLGYADKNNSYIHFLILKIIGIDLPENWVDALTVILFFVAFSVSVFLVLRNKLRKIKLRNGSSFN